MLIHSRGGLPNFPAQRVGKFALPTLEWVGGAATGGALSPSGTVAGDINIGVDSTATTTPPVTVATGGTWIDSGVSSDETSDASIRAAYLVSTGTDDGIGAAGSSRRLWLTLRSVDTALFIASLSAGVTYAYNATTGANIISSSLAPGRSGIFLLWVRQSTANTNTFTNPATLITTQNSGSAELQVYWTGASASLDTAGIALMSYTGQSHALSNSTLARATFACWVPGAAL